MRRRISTSRGLPSVLGAVCLVLLVTLAGGCGGEESGSQTEEATEQGDARQESAETTEAAETEATASIGEPVTIGNVQWTVTDAEQLDELLSNKGEYEQGSFVSMDITFSNNSNQDVTLATPFLTLLDGQGREIEADIEDNFLHVYADENMFVDHVKPGATKVGKVIFSVDPDASGLKLQVGEARFASNKTAYIDLGTPRPASEVL